MLGSGRLGSGSVTCPGALGLAGDAEGAHLRSGVRAGRGAAPPQGPVCRARRAQTSRSPKPQQVTRRPFSRRCLAQWFWKAV